MRETWRRRRTSLSRRSSGRWSESRRALPRLARAGPIPFKAWLIVISMNLGKNHRRNRQRWKRVVVNRPPPEAWEPAESVDRLERQERARSVDRAVRALTPRQKEVFVLRIDRELRFTEIAQLLSTTPNNCKVHFHHAVRRLKAQLNADQDAESGSVRDPSDSTSEPPRRAEPRYDRARSTHRARALSA